MAARGSRPGVDGGKRSSLKESALFSRLSRRTWLGGNGGFFQMDVPMEYEVSGYPECSMGQVGQDLIVMVTNVSIDVNI